MTSPGAVPSGSCRVLSKKQPLYNSRSSVSPGPGAVIALLTWRYPTHNLPTALDAGLSTRNCFSDKYVRLNTSFYNELSFALVHNLLGPSGLRNLTHLQTSAVTAL